MRGNISICKTVITSTLFNMINSSLYIPMNDKCTGVYAYKLEILCRSINILISIMRNSFEDISSIELIIMILTNELS